MTEVEAETMWVRVVQLSMRLSRKYLHDYSCAKSRRDFTQPQLLTCLVLRAVARTDYRGVCEILLLSPALREAIGLEKVPHWTTLQKFMARPEIPLIIDRMIGAVLKETGQADKPTDIAIDSSGLQSGVASIHYQTRRWEEGGTPVRKTVKISLAIVCGSMLPAALVIDLGSSADMTQMPALMTQIEMNTTPGRLFADKGYDAEWVHEIAREKWHAESYIPPVIRAPDGKIKTHWRSMMRELPAAFGRRWHAESFFSALKRTMLSTLSSRNANTLINEAAMKILAYAIRR